MPFNWETVSIRVSKGPVVCEVKVMMLSVVFIILTAISIISNTD